MPLCAKDKANFPEAKKNLISISYLSYLIAVKDSLYALFFSFSFLGLVSPSVLLLDYLFILQHNQNSFRRCVCIITSWAVNR